jgi:hypothetical protein
MYPAMTNELSDYPPPCRLSGDVIHTIIFGSIFEQWISAETKLRNTIGTHRP